jgi:hypothetical protein
MDSLELKIAVRRARAEYFGRTTQFVSIVGEPSPFGETVPGGVPLSSLVQMVGFAKESELAERVLDRLAPWFEISREVPGTFCDGKRRLRIDAVIRSKRVDSSDRDVTFGLEFKRIAPVDDDNQWPRLVAQSVSYTHVDWDGFGRLLVFICPGYDGAHSLGELLTQFGVGELVLLYRYGLTFRMSGQRIWSEHDGFIPGRHWKLDLKSGHR